MDNENGVLFGKICAKMRKDYAQSLREYNLHVGQDHALVELWKHDGITQTQLSERMGCEPPTLTKMLKSLEEYGLVKREKDADDARISRVFLTDQGQALEQPIFKIRESFEGKMFAGICLEEKILFRSILDKIFANLHR